MCLAAAAAAVSEMVAAVGPVLGASAALTDRLVLAIRKASFSKDVQVMLMSMTMMHLFVLTLTSYLFSSHTLTLHGRSVRRLLR